MNLLNSESDYHNPIDPQLTIAVYHDSGILGWVVIDSTIRNHAHGGLRMKSDIELSEICDLAHGMTLKFSLLGLPHGGAKAGVRMDPEASLEKRQRTLAVFARAIAPLLRNRIYIPATDMGTENTDIQYMLKSIGVPIKKRENQKRRSGYFTAFTVLTGLEKAIEHSGKSLSGCRVAIEGFGKVGSALGELLADRGIRVVAVSTSKGGLYNPKGLNIKRLQELVVEKGSLFVKDYQDAERIKCAELLELPVDILCPCADYHSITEKNVDRIQAEIICAGSNNPITPDAEKIMFDRGVLCLPDFVTNCGGVIGGTMEFASIGKNQIEKFIGHHIGARIVWLLSESSRKGMMPSELAKTLALERFNKLQQMNGYSKYSNQFFEVGLELYRRGWIPGRLVASLSIPYFKRSIT